MGHGTGVLWGGLTPLRGVLIRPQRVPTTGKVGGSAADPIQGGGLVGVVEWVLKTGVIEHLGRVYGGGLASYCQSLQPYSWRQTASTLF